MQHLCGSMALFSQAQCMLHDCLRGTEKPLSHSLTRMLDKAWCQKGQDGAHSNYGKGMPVSLATRLQILCDLLFTTSNLHSVI